MNELPELATIENTVRVILGLTNYTHKFNPGRGRVGIATVGGVKVIVKVMQMFPVCEALQAKACHTLFNLAHRRIGNAKAFESGGVEGLLTAVTAHLGSADLFQKACAALENIVRGCKERTGILISLGGAAAVAKVRTRWPDNHDFQKWVRSLLRLIVDEMESWIDGK